MLLTQRNARKIGQSDWHLVNPPSQDKSNKPFGLLFCWLPLPNCELLATVVVCWLPSTIHEYTPPAALADGDARRWLEILSWKWSMEWGWVGFNVGIGSVVQVKVMAFSSDSLDRLEFMHHEPTKISSSLVWCLVDNLADHICGSVMYRTDPEWELPNVKCFEDRKFKQIKYGESEDLGQKSYKTLGCFFQN